MTTVSGHEARLAEEGRRQALGAWYTPPDVVEGLLCLVLDPLLAERRAEGIDAVRRVRVLDPACGTGNFLVAAAERIAAVLVQLGDPVDAAWRTAVGACVGGVDLDAPSVAEARQRLVAASGDAVSWEELEPRFATANAFDLGPDRWRSLAGGAPFDVVVGNPPFLGQLRRTTRHDPSAASAVRDRFGGVVASYTDPAVLFLLLATELVRPDDGRVALVLPLSFLAARDAGPIRRRLLEDAVVDHLWVADERVFDDASVDVCAPVLRLGAARPVRSTSISVGRAFRSVEPAPAPTAASTSWSPLLGAAFGLPRRQVAGSGTLSELATATADFRDQYYGLAPHVFDDVDPDGERLGGTGDGDPSPDGQATHPALVTVGLIDPAHLAWGERATRFNKRSYRRPRVRRADLGERLGAWAAARLVPKVLLATQTKVLEAVVDGTGALLPSVPVISIVPVDPTDPMVLDRLGALLTSPPVTLLASLRHLGAGRSREALKLRATEVLDLPLPDGVDHWDEAAVHFRLASAAIDGGDRRRHLLACGTAMNRAFGLGDDPDLLAWWSARLPA